jgi:hypothetical protein
MKRTALAMILTVVLFLTIFISQPLSLVNANPVGWPFKHENPWGYPEITITSPNPVSYPQNSVWLNLTVTKPSKWLDLEGHLTFVAYLIDGNRESLIGSLPYDNVGETRVAVNDPIGSLTQQLEFNLSIKLEGLSEGNHHIDVAAYGFVNDENDIAVGTIYHDTDIPIGTIYHDTINFMVTEEPSALPTTFPPSPTPTPTKETTPLPTINTGPSPYYFDDFIIGGIAGAVAIIILVLLYHFTRRK